MSFCLDTYLMHSEDYSILVNRKGFKEVKKAINDNSKEIVNIKPGEKILGVRIIGIPPIPVGINSDKGTVIIPYTKPCYGTSAIELPVSSEQEKEIRDVAIE